MRRAQIACAFRAFRRGAPGPSPTPYPHLTEIFADTPSDLVAALKGATVTATGRHGKQLWLELAHAKQRRALAIHLGMTGHLAVRGRGRVAYVNTDTGTDGAGWPPRFTKLVLEFDGAAAPPLAAAYADPRRFGRVALVDDPASLAAGLAPDALALPPDWAATHLVARGGRRAVKTALMDQKRVTAGVGNWVADEVLLAAGVHPEAVAASLTPRQAAAIAAAVTSVCEAAVAVDADAGRFPADWIFHVRWDQKPGARVRGHPVSWITVGGRTTAFVPALQKKSDDDKGKGTRSATAPPPLPPPPPATKAAPPARPAKRRAATAPKAAKRAAASRRAV